MKTPGREDDEQETRLYSKQEYQAKGSNDGLGESIVVGLGGRENIEVVDNCYTRLRVTVKDVAIIDEPRLKATGAKGIIKQGNNVQVVYGLHVKKMREAWVDGHNTLELVMKPQLASVLFRFRPEAAMDDAAIALLNQKIGDALLESGRANVGVTEHNGITCLKLTLLNPTVTLEDVKVLLSLVERTALEILAK
jgi:glucose-like phosphotransferase system IIB component